MRYIIKNILSNKLSNIFFIVINFIVLLSIILTGSLIRETLQLNNDLNKRINNGTQIELDFTSSMKIDDMNNIVKNLFSDELYEVGKIGIIIGEKRAVITGINKVNSKILRISSGRYLSEQEILNGEDKVLIGKFFDEYTFNKNGRKLINIFDKEYEVVGVLGYKIGNSLYDDSIYLPFTSLPSDIKNSEANAIYIYGSKKLSLGNIGNGKVESLNNISGYNEINISKSLIYSNIDYYKGLIIKITTMSICVLINFYLLMSMMIKRRSKEISIKKAIGFTNKIIMKEIFLEITSLSVISLLFSILFYKYYQLRLIDQIGSSVYISLSVILFVFIVLIINCLILSGLQLRNIDKCSLSQVMQE